MDRVPTCSRAVHGDREQQPEGPGVRWSVAAPPPERVAAKTFREVDRGWSLVPPI
jgi:hypothetical protein